MNAWQAAGVSLLTAVLTGAFVGPITAYVTALISANRYKVEKWWDKKLEIYEIILGQIHDINEYHERELENYDDVTILTKEKIAEMQILAIASRLDLYKRARIGSFIISEKAEAILEILESDLSRANRATDWYQSMDGGRMAATKAFRLLRDEARADLGPAPTTLNGQFVEPWIKKIRNRQGHPDLGG